MVRTQPELGQVIQVSQADEARQGLNSQGHKGSLQLSRALVPRSLALVQCSFHFLSCVNCSWGRSMTGSNHGLGAHQLD